MNSSKLQLKTKSILSFALGMVFALTAAIALMPAEANAAVNWVANPASCPQSDPVNFPGQNCSPNNMCGDSSGIAQCYDTGSISAPAVNVNSSVLYASALTGGYVINCFTASDSGSPYCDNNGAAWCNRDASCYGGGNNRLTTCLAGTWAYEGASSYTCGDCLTTHLDCTGDTKCEVQKNVTTYPTGGNNHYGTTCDVADVRCNTSYYDCDASGVTLGNGCEAYRSGACTAAGGLPGTWSCAVDAGGTCTDGGSNYTCTCVTPKCPFESATLCQYFSSDPLLWGKQLGSGELIRMGNATKDDAFVVNNDGSIRMSTTSAPGVTTNLLYNVGGDLYWDGTLIGAGASSSALDFQQVTDLGNITTNWIEFAGGTSTADLVITGDLNISGDAFFVNATGTNLTVAEQFLLGQYAVLPAAGYQAGSMVFNTTDSVPYFWDGSSWIAFATGTGVGGGTLDDAYNFGGAAAGRQVFTVDGSTPVEILNPGTDQWETSLALTNSANGGGIALQTMDSFGDWGSKLYLTDNTSDPINGTGGFLDVNNLSQSFEFGYQTAGTRNSSFYIDYNQMALNVPGTPSNGAFGIMATNYNVPVLRLTVPGSSFNNQIHMSVGTSTPEAKVTADSGSVYFRTDGAGSNQQMYVKTTDTGNTGWFALAGAGVANSIWDADSDTGIQVEESADEDIIRFDVAGHQAMKIDPTAGEPLVAINSTLGGYANILQNINDEYDHFEIRAADVLNAFGGDLVFNFNPEEGFALYYASNQSSMSIGRQSFNVAVNNHQDAIRVDQNAFVGLSTSSPMYRLDVVGDARVSNQLMLGQYALNPLAGLQAGAMVYNTASSTPFFWDGTEWIAFATGTGAGAGDLQAVTDLGNITTNWIEFAGGTSTGNFLINRPTAEAYLTVNSGNSDAYFDLIGNAGATALRMSSNGGGNYASFEIASNGSFNMVADGTGVIWGDAPTGNVGIGESSPTYRLQIDGGALAGNNLFRAEAGLNSGYISMYVSSTDDRNSVIGFQRNLEFFSQNQMVMTITNNERVGVGITSPLYSLDVLGDVRLSAELLLGQYPTNPLTGSAAGSLIYNSSDDLLYFWDNSEWRALLADGDVTLDEAYDGTGAGQGRQITADSGAVRISGAGNGTALQIDYTGTGQGFAFNNSGGGDGVVIAQTGTGLGMYIRQNAGIGLQLDNNTANHGLSIDTNSTGEGIYVLNDGNSGIGMRIDNATDGSGIYINDTLGKSAINIVKPSGSGDLIRLSNQGAGDALDISHTSSGKAVRLANTGTGDSFYITDEASDTTPFVLTANGDLGIGAATPDARLEIAADNSLGDVSLLKFQATNDSDIQSEIYFSGGGNATNWNVNSSGNGGALAIIDGTTEVAKFLINGLIINDGSAANIDFRVESDTNTHSLFADATNGYVGFDQSVPLAKLHVGNTTAGSAADYNYMRLQGAGDVDHRLYIPTGSNLMIWDYNVTGNGGAIEFRNGASRVGLFTNSGLVINEGGVTGVGLRVEGDTNVNLLFTDATNDRVGIGTNAPGVRFHATQSANTVAAFDRTTSDGVIVSLRQDGTEEGTISVSGVTVSYNAFTGSHYAWIDEQIERGMLVSLTGENRNLHNSPQSEIVYGVTKTAIVNDSKVMGSYLALQESNKAYDESNPHLIMAVGNGEVWVADKGENINIGDYLISSDVVGHAQKDTGEFIVSHIIAKAAEAIDWSNVTTEIDGVKHKKISVFFESFDKSNMQSSLAGTSLQGGDTNLEVVDLAVGNAVFEGSITVMEHVVLSRDAVGQAMILTGENRVLVAFEVPYDELPIVTVTPYGAKRMDYGVENVSLTGFEIVIDPIQYQDTIFNWHVFGNREAKVFVSNGTTLEIEMTDMGTSKLETQINANGTTSVPAPVEEIAEIVPAEPETVAEPSPVEELLVEEADDQPLPESEVQTPTEPEQITEEGPAATQETISEPEQNTETEI